MIVVYEIYSHQFDARKSKVRDIINNLERAVRAHENYFSLESERETKFDSAKKGDRDEKSGLTKTFIFQLSTTYCKSTNISVRLILAF